ncbi:GntR family transcriptional regulator [Leifsonia sp. F6_8S_P_1B]|uniref:GntR family transcriptional regulator n=1 Tax=Leifsonia williamsii TaxID=3035919 RepID=A0ABT8KB35_9MICO|nr:GntR family transcriptional regulator [Leifsonia williamsii]MDN4613559.1 GntR family transcriptional regulator [Leifsonia williamsii]
MPMPTDHVERVSLSQEAYNRIEAAIMEGVLEPGERLRDPELAEWLGISRTPIRHALDRLMEQGLVEMERNRYTRVAPLDVEGVIDALQVTGDLWGGAALRGYPFWEEDDDALVSEIVDSLLDAAREDDIVRYVTIFQHLVVTFAQIEGNAVRQRALSNVIPQLRRVGRKLKGRIDHARLESFTSALLDHARARDGRATITLIDDFIARLSDRLRTF